jgi:hypothetical protein
MLAPVVGLLLHILFFGLAFLWGYPFPDLFLHLIFLVGSVLLVLVLLVVSSPGGPLTILVLGLVLIFIFLLLQVGSKLELALEVSYYCYELLLVQRLGSPDLVDLEVSELGGCAINFSCVKFAPNFPSS